MKHYYALYDTFVFGSKKYSHGFCNTKDVLAFESKKERDRFLKDVSWYDLSARAITHKEAMKFAKCTYDLWSSRPEPVLRRTDFFEFGEEIYRDNLNDDRRRKYETLLRFV